MYKQKMENKKPRTLEELCDGDLKKELLGNEYCALSYNKRVDCFYLSKDKDHNGHYTCQKSMYEDLKKQ